jgi:phosphonatase-like hydrolase
MGIEMVMFDLAGTTVQDQDGLVANVFLDVSKKQGISTTPAEINSMRGRSKIEVFRFLVGRQFGSTMAAAEAEAKAQNAHADFQSQILAAYRKACPPVDGAVECFKFLHEHGVKVGAGTGFDLAIMNTVLDSLGWLRDGLVDVAVSAEEVPSGRPAPYMIFTAMMRLGKNSVRNVVKVGDTPADMQEGTNAGCGGIVGVLSGASDAATLGKHHHTHLIPSVKDFPALVKAAGWI